MMELKRLARNLNIPVILTVPLKAELPDTLQQIPCLNDIDSDRIVNIAGCDHLAQQNYEPE